MAGVVSRPPAERLIPTLHSTSAIGPQISAVKVMLRPGSESDLTN